MLTEQHGLGLRSIDDQRDHDLALRAELRGRRTADTAFSDERLQHVAPQVARVDLEARSQQRARDAEPHGPQTDDTDISRHA
ncbi:hypothetical protein QFZ99_006272 [Paraburkholderia atlantica]